MPGQQIVDAVPSVPFLDDPAPQMVEQLQDIMRFFDTLSPVAERVITVPKILPNDVPSRHAAVGTAGGSADDRILFFIAAADHGAERWHSSSQSWRAICWCSRFPPAQSSTAPVAQIVDIPVSGGGLQGFRTGQSSTASSSSSHSPAGVCEDLVEPGVGVFALFPTLKKVRRPQTPPSIHAGSAAARRCLGHGPRCWGALLLEPPHRGDTLEHGG